MNQRLNRVIMPLGEIRRLRQRIQPRSRFTFLLERLLLRGAHYRLLVIAMILGLVALAGGLLALAVGEEFGGPGDAIWWAFLRLTDPGYLGDDEGVARRLISTSVTMAGCVFFMGALVAILTQWLTQTIRGLERGLTPIAVRDHLLVLGWTNRTSAVVHELVLSEERVQRFLRRRGTRRLRIVILAEEVDPEIVQELADALGPEWDPNQVIFRSGTPQHIDHLARVAFLQAGAVILPAADFGAADSGDRDAAIVKVLLSIARHGQLVEQDGLPLVVTEIFDPRRLHVARQAYGGRVEIVLSSHVISRLFAQTVRHPGMTAVFNELMGHSEGCEFYVRDCPELVGLPFEDLFGAFPHGILLGVVRPSGDSFAPILNPPPGFVVSAEDRLVVLGANYALTDPQPAARSTVRRGVGTGPPPPRSTEQRLLILGWNRKVAVLSQELEDYQDERFDVDVVSNVPVAHRDRVAGQLDVRLERTGLRHLERDFTSVVQLQELALREYDSILLVASEWLDTEQEADARTLLGTLLLRSELAEGSTPHIAVELMDPENAQLLQGTQVEHLISPVIISHILAQVALRRELRAVYDELFGPGGAEIHFRFAGDYGLVGEAIPFEELSRRAYGHGEIALGVRVDGQVRMIPPPDAVFRLAESDELVVVTTYDRSGAAA